MAAACLSDDVPLDLTPCMPAKIAANTPQNLELDKNLLLAENPLPLHMKWIAEGRAKKTLTDVLVECVKKHLNKTRFQEGKYRPAVSMILANAFYGHKRSGQTLYSRDTGHKKDEQKNPENITNETVINVVDALIYYDYLSGEKGAANEFQRVKSWFECTDKLLVLFNNTEILIRESKKTPEIQLRDKEKAPKAISKHNKEIRLAKKLKRPVSDFNAFWLKHNATVNGELIIPYLHRVFNIRLDWGGRFYGHYQTMKKDKRQYILIDGEPTVELDYSCLHINLLYAEKGIQFDGDAYDKIGLLDASLSNQENRKLLKLLMLVFVNSESVRAFKANITKSGNPEIKKRRPEYLEKARFLKKKVLEKRFPEMKGFIEDLPDNLQGEIVFNMIINAHPEIKDLFNKKRVGSKLQFKDSQIMATCLTKLIKLNVAVLPVHDSLICASGYEYLVSNAMQEAYSEHTNGLKITIK